jgi:hypothetical protein
MRNGCAAGMLRGSTIRRAAAGAAAVAALAAIAAAAAPGSGGGPVLRMLPSAQLTPASAPANARATTTAASASTPCWASSNWSGYAVSQTSPSGLPCVPASGKTYTAVSGTWTVPTVTGSRFQSTYSAAWTGIDGFTNSSLIQAGTEQDFVAGTARYTAWWEILPAAETPITSITVAPGDSITVSIAQVSGTTWKITLTDNGKAGHAAQPPFTTTQTYTGPGTSAEWILEAPQVGNRIATLAHYGSTTFDLGTADGASPSLAGGTSGEMAQGFFFRPSVVSIASAPDTGNPVGDGFAIAYGSVAPPAPTT